jgi:cargo-transport protein YPP1
VEPEDALQIYRYWAKYWNSTGKGIDTADMARPRRSAWKAYYDTLSVILQNHLPYDVEQVSANAITEKTITRPQLNIRLQQRAELKRVETIYETLLLKEISFPKASENNHEIEAWTDAVMENWRILCGPTWSDDDLGEGGKEAAGRGVLDVSGRHIDTIVNHKRTRSNFTGTDTLPCSNQDVSFDPDIEASFHCSCFSC